MEFERATENILEVREKEDGSEEIKLLLIALLADACSEYVITYASQA